MSDLGIFLEAEDRENFLRRILLPFETHSEAAEWMPVSKYWVDSFSSGRQKTVDLQTMKEFDRFLKASDLEILNRNIVTNLQSSEGDGTLDSSNRPVLDQAWKNYLFEIFGNKRLAEMTDYGVQTVDNYSPGSLNRNPPREFWRDVNRETDIIYDETRLQNIESNLIDMSGYNTGHSDIEESKIVDKIPLSEIFCLEKIAERYVHLKEHYPLIESNIDGSYHELFQQLKEELENGNKFISPSKYDMDSAKAGYGLKVLDDIGVIDEWSDSRRSTYEIDQRQETIERIQKLFFPQRYDLETGIEDLANGSFSQIDFEILYS